MWKRRKTVIGTSRHLNTPPSLVLEWFQIPIPPSIIPANSLSIHRSSKQLLLQVYLSVEPSCPSVIRLVSCRLVGLLGCRSVKVSVKWRKDTLPSSSLVCSIIPNSLDRFCHNSLEKGSRYNIGLQQQHAAADGFAEPKIEPRREQVLDTTHQTRNCLLFSLSLHREKQKFTCRLRQAPMKITLSVCFSFRPFLSSS